ncbi:hypothetical protein ACKWRH_21335 [Bradyrhizobium sp. Pa8]|uniref:hypothetical protein n=1 Tax=Bradyrhizobium sp. Pa8 TaxID=3386552 RepID=UPI00403F4189
MTVNVIWVDHGREPQCAPNPNFPNGVDVDLRRDKEQPGCSADLPYPAKRCGHHLVQCDVCGYSVAITTAGRPDDPRRITLPCKSN